MLLCEELPKEISEEVAHVPHEEVIPSEAPVLVVVTKSCCSCCISAARTFLQLIQLCYSILCSHPIIVTIPIYYL